MFYCRFGVYVVEQYKFFVVFFNDVIVVFFVVCQYVVKYDEIGIVVKGFCYIVWCGVVIIVDDYFVQIVCSIGIFDYCRKLWIIDVCFDVSCINRIWVNVNFNDIGI